eukprot:CAMPEP_0206166888 /NCGR_PEP_ID=MMETSP1474-20131121/25813_1 /ASSEMBLY_ACC=CAM_ASM_001110 /TAXON_ID=97495 /ORGANISM="Imantonia sp., Strain RCC918" /LENGTH=279 /DNA_ID=CAMNT_0053571173 /DNA_START=54 /DNA_END=892 /DNA_ORIENTATION=+
MIIAGPPPSPHGQRHSTAHASRHRKRARPARRSRALQQRPAQRRRTHAHDSVTSSSVQCVCAWSGHEPLLSSLVEAAGQALNATEESVSLRNGAGNLMGTAPGARRQCAASMRMAPPPAHVLAHLAPAAAATSPRPERPSETSQEEATASELIMPRGQDFPHRRLLVRVAQAHLLQRAALCTPPEGRAAVKCALPPYLHLGLAVLARAPDVRHAAVQLPQFPRLLGLGESDLRLRLIKDGRHQYGLPLSASCPVRQRRGSAGSWADTRVESKATAAKTA